MHSRRFMRPPRSTLWQPDYQMSYAALKLLLHRDGTAFARSPSGRSQLKLSQRLEEPRAVEVVAAGRVAVTGDHLEAVPAE